MALGKSVLTGTSSGVIDERTGVSIACTMPSNAASVITTHTLGVTPQVNATRFSVSMMDSH